MSMNLGDEYELLNGTRLIIIDFDERDLTFDILDPSGEPSDNVDSVSHAEWSRMQPVRYSIGTPGF